MLKIALSREKPALFPKREKFASKKITKTCSFCSIQCYFIPLLSKEGNYKKRVNYKKKAELDRLSVPLLKGKLLVRFQMSSTLLAVPKCLLSRLVSLVVQVLFWRYKDGGSILSRGKECSIVGSTSISKIVRRCSIHLTLAYSILFKKSGWFPKSCVRFQK